MANASCSNARQIDFHSRWKKRNINGARVDCRGFAIKRRLGTGSSAGTRCGLACIQISYRPFPANLRKRANSAVRIFRLPGKKALNRRDHREKTRRAEAKQKGGIFIRPSSFHNYSAASSSVSPSVRMSSSARSASSYACETSSCTFAAASSISGDRRTLR